jgi:hypothetical protein
MDRINDFLMFVRTEVDLDPDLCPCDPANVGKALAWLNAMAAAYQAEAARAAAEQETARGILRQRISAGVREHLRGSPLPSRQSPSPSGNGNGNGDRAPAADGNGANG